jgi:uncharacterized protein YjbI with pentapeptide repeats
MTPTELAAIIDGHRLWLAGKGGQRANLSYADLSHANLSYADLSYADLRDADLSHADLSYADLRYAILSDAILSDAILSYANLRHADLSYADLSDAILSSANLSYANLSETTGIVWARSGPCGHGPREILGWWTPAEGLVVAAGCFRGSPAEMRTRVAAGGWEWPARDRDRLAASVEKHLARVEGDVTEWLEACHV